MRTQYDKKLNELHENVTELGKLVKEAIRDSVESLVSKNNELAQKVIEQDSEINKLHFYIEKECINLISLQQPVAKDLRRITAMLKMVTDLERMADHAVSIAKVRMRLKEDEYVKPLVQIPVMAEITEKMVDKVLKAFLDTDTDTAYELKKDDEEIDNIYKKIYEELTDLMQKDGGTVHQGTQLLFVAHHLERIGDHATNIGEWIYYLGTGKMVELNP